MRRSAQVRELTVSYEALRNIKLLIDDNLAGGERELTIWFARKNKMNIQEIRF